MSLLTFRSNSRLPILFAAILMLPGQGNANAYVEMMTVHLDAPVSKLPPPENAAARKEAFAARNSPEQVKKLADQLFALWDWDQKGSSRMQVTRRLHARKAQVGELYKEGKYQEALDAFRAYFFTKVVLLWNDEKGLASRDFEARFSRDFATKNYEDNVMLLMVNTYQARTTKETGHLGDMGALRWDWQPGGLQNPWYTPKVFEYFASEQNFRTLWWKFVDTGDRRYLDKYLEYYDDYTLNYRFQENLNPLNLDYGKQGHGDLENFIHAISEVARVLPPDGEGFPSATLARILIRHLAVTLPQSVYYNREQPGNHSCGAVHVYQYLSSFLYDFKIAIHVLEHESRRQFEIYNALVDLPDGSMYSRSAGYSRHEFTENSIYVNKVKEADLDWLTPSQELEFQERLADRVYWYFNLFDASGEHVNGVSAGRRNMDFSARVNLIARFQPQALRDPSLQAIAVAILRNQTGPDWSGKTHTNPDNPLLQGGLFAREPPPYTSISFPYNHISIMRSGWDMNDDQTGAFLHSSEQGLNGGLFLRGKNCNSLTISAFNQALLVNGTEYAYNYVRSPIQVDGQDQFARAGLTGHARKGEHNPGEVVISPWRTHHSAAFDVTEGHYGGIYAESPDHEPLLYHYKTNLQVLDNALEGELSHHRIVQFVKESGLWIVLDIMEADRPRTYTQQWWMSKLTDKNPDGYKEESVSADPDRSMFQSHAEEKANISMHHVGPALLGADTRQLLTYNPVKTYIKQEEWYKGYRADRRPGVEFLHLATDWQSEAGRSQLITVIYPLRKGQSESDLQIERAANGREVTVTTSKGDRIHFVADGLESTLTVRNKGEVRERGVVLSAGESYEFARDDNGAEERSPIYRPIGELVISPNVSAFADEIAVRIAAAEENVEVRYTTDGSDPNLHSPVYAGALALSESTTLKARGFRKGLEEMPVNRAGNTMMSRVYRAQYVKASPHEPLPDELTDDLKRGLRYSYYEDKWPKLLFGAPLSSASKTGTVDSIFDSPRSGKENQAFAFRYEGYFKAPRDGIYTMYAPEEFYKYWPLAGYDLDVHLGYENRWNQGIKADVGPDTPLQKWYPGTRRHALGTWSVFLKKGYHPIRVYFADIRPGGHMEYMHFEYDGVNVPGLIGRYWEGDVPELEIAGPGIERQSIPRRLLYN